MFAQNLKQYSYFQIDSQAFIPKYGENSMKMRTKRSAAIITRSQQGVWNAVKEMNVVQVKKKKKKKKKKRKKKTNISRVELLKRLVLM